LFAGCGRAQLPPAAEAPPQASADTADRTAVTQYRSIYSFKGTKDGESPKTGLTALDGTLFGTTPRGGKGYHGGYGIVFGVSTSGKEQVLHRFYGVGDGKFPSGDLVAYNGMLYGETQTGTGGAKRGTVFEIGPSGGEHVLYRFKGAPDGDGPSGKLLVLDGTLYGTTESGGTTSEYCNRGGCGTVFSLSPSGSEHVIYRFSAQSEEHNNGTAPIGGVIAVGNRLYGLAGSGGQYDEGALFAVTLSGKGKLVFSFGAGGSSGIFRPLGELTSIGNELYGVTNEGGTRSLGSVYEVNATDGAGRLLYSFGTKNLLGDDPEGGLYYRNGWLYGVSDSGGYSDRGTIYRVRPSGTKSEVLYEFAGPPDGESPEGAVTSLQGIFYGTTETGGSAGKCGECGTVWQLKL
jgi:uncharacterized repeat protein (TIGR03803 family)